MIHPHGIILDIWYYLFIGFFAFTLLGCAFGYISMVFFHQNEIVLIIATVLAGIGVFCGASNILILFGILERNSKRLGLK